MSQGDSSKRLLEMSLLHSNSHSESRGSSEAPGGFKPTLAKSHYTAKVKEVLQVGCGRVLETIQKEVLLLLEKDTLPRFKASPLFAQYVEAEPVLFQVRDAKR